MKAVKNLNITELKVKTIEELALEKHIDMKELSVKINEKQHKGLKLLAFNTGTSMSEIIRAFLQQFIEQFDPENVVEVQPEPDSQGVL